MTPALLLRRARTLVLGLVSALAGFGLTVSPGCGTDVKGVDECRDIEHARCQAAASCGTVTDVEACQRFYRDHCLHGMAVPAPSPDAVSRCVQTIESAGRCASAAGNDVRIEDCADSDILSASGALLACDIVAFPERADRCAFLTATPAPGGGEGGAGGESANGG